MLEQFTGNDDGVRTGDPNFRPIQDNEVLNLDSKELEIDNPSVSEASSQKQQSFDSDDSEWKYRICLKNEAQVDVKSTDVSPSEPDG